MLTVSAHQADSVQPPAATGPAGSLIYEAYYGLREKPFSLAADPKFLYKSPSHASAFEDLLAAIRRREGLIVLTGDIGTGKTTLCRAVLEHLDRKTFASFVPDPFLSRQDLLKMLLIDFGVMSVEDLKKGRLEGASRTDLSYVLYEFLVSLVPLQAFAVLITDEAQNLSLPLLEEIRILSDLGGRGGLLQVMLVGQPDLGSKLKLPQMRQVDQRVTMRCELEPLSREGVAGYITHRLLMAGGGNDRIEFSAGALDVVFRGSGGVPRVINLICDRALQRGYLTRTARIDSEIVSSAIADLRLEVSPASDSLELVAETTPRGLFERTGAGTGEWSSERDLNALLNIAPLPLRQPDQAAAELDRPESSAFVPIVEERPKLPEIRNAERTPARTWHRDRRLLPAAAALLMGLAGTIGGGLGYLQRVRQLAADTDAVVYLPPPPPLWTVRGFKPPLPPDVAQVTELLPESPAEPATRAAGTSATKVEGRFIIQVAYFDNPQQARFLVKQLADAGYRAYQVGLDVGPDERLYEVFVGPYETVAEAELDLADVQQMPVSADARVVGAPRAAP